MDQARRTVLKKHAWKRLFVSSKGSVSVYLIVIIVPIFLFHAVLIDYARVNLAEREVEMNVKTGVRSLLSGFDTNLQTYGLFGLTENMAEMKSTFSEIISENLTPQYSGTYIQLLDAQLNANKVSLKSVYTLANQIVFRQQILEDMKYKAPIEYSLEFVNKFKKTDVTKQLNASAQFSGNAEKLEMLLEQRNTALDDAWNEATQFLDHAETNRTLYDGKIAKLQKLADQIGLNSLGNIQSSIATIEQNMQQMNDNHYIIEYMALLQETKLSISYDFTMLSEDYNTVIEKLKLAENDNLQLSNEKNRLINEANESPDKLSSDEIFQHILIYDLEYFSQYKTGLGKILASFSGLKTRLENAAIIAANFSQQWMQDSDSMNEQNLQFRQQQGAKEDQRKQAYSQMNQKKTEQKDKLNQAVQEAKKALNGCSLFGNDSFNPIYAKLNGVSSQNTPGLYNKYQNYNSNLEVMDAAEHPYALESGEKASKNATSWIQQFSGMMTGFRDELYLDEYTLSKFNYRTDSSSNDSDKANRPLKNQEVEYILYGLNSCAANYSAAYGEMYVMFLAIRTLEQLIKPQNELLNAGSPLLVFLAAAAQGAVEALDDMSNLMKGKAVPVLKKAPQITVDYKELLRIFMLLHLDDGKMMSRMQALIELNIDVPLEQKTTYIQGSAAVSVRLWFIPELIKSLNSLGISHCRVQANRCEITKTAVMSY
ncbi:MAG: hypothetical protein JWM44_1159 [Bacilli bacterium]|nr:hypothetical protein [Bacilli bacterium]